MLFSPGRAGRCGRGAGRPGRAGGGAGAPAHREADDLLAGSAAAPVAHYVNSILLEAVKRGASDIHIEPFARALTVRYRIDGLLYEQPSPPRNLENALTARLKVMARLDLAEKRLPQDGVARVRVGASEIDVRVSSVPVAEGERIVLRLLHRESTRYSLNELGMPRPAGAVPRHPARAPRDCPGDRADRQRKNHDALCRAARTGHRTPQRADH